MRVCEDEKMRIKSDENDENFKKKISLEIMIKLMINCVKETQRTTNV
jgi:hypothetical protein